MQQGQVLLGLVVLKEAAAEDITELIHDLNEAGLLRGRPACAPLLSMLIYPPFC